jgi:putative transposase
VAPSTYYAHKARQISPCARAVRDAVMVQVLMALWVANRKVYGAEKLWKAARRAGIVIGRDQTARLMRSAGMVGVTRRRKVFTTRQDPDATRAGDLVNRIFKADRPDALWVTDLKCRRRHLKSATHHWSGRLGVSTPACSGPVGGAPRDPGGS